MILYEICSNMYIGSFEGFLHEIEKKEHEITHVIGLVSFKDKRKLIGYKSIFFEINDESDENIIQYFPEGIKFIEECFNMDEKNKILIFCQAGISRSTTIAAAYLMKKRNISKEEAILCIKKVHPNAEPNPGFIQQLQLFYDCKYVLSNETKLYRQWLYKHKIHSSLQEKKAPVISLYCQNESIRSDQIHLQCKKCRVVLANSNCIIDHKPPQSFIECSHFFLEPLTWMKNELDNGNIEGKLNCPKCNSRVGKYAWQGMHCSCKEWVTPALSIQKSKIDVIKKELTK
ncbi:hypothetical protein T552_01443 [Pneumocystis carinii B80]|uniref:protein-tyrosine-phosphatase n=1 Tax=Pneumocystis carinii (strain B80) TaxID=1408658 RepID=A0A0W4ZKB2_PNEC8|nr:hypothetical protein T552_01443 [Pneumocystis carinii B80]KTW28813.1 hypothetical protein T552_01443 [Pneumocystis carinii B80]